MKKYVKKPVEIEAEQWVNWSQKILPEVKPYGIIWSDVNECKHCGIHFNKHGKIMTLEGMHIVCPGDWIIKGVKGEFYPCKDDIFKLTYEEVH